MFFVITIVGILIIVSFVLCWFVFVLLSVLGLYGYLWVYFIVLGLVGVRELFDFSYGACGCTCGVWWLRVVMSFVGY